MVGPLHNLNLELDLIKWQTVFCLVKTRVIEFDQNRKIMVFPCFGYGRVQWMFLRRQSHKLSNGMLTMSGRGRWWHKSTSLSCGVDVEAIPLLSPPQMYRRLQWSTWPLPLRNYFLSEINLLSRSRIEGRYWISLEMLFPTVWGLFTSTWPKIVLKFVYFLHKVNTNSDKLIFYTLNL